MSAITEIQRVSLEFSEEITFNVGSFLQDIKNKIENINIYKVYFFKTNTPFKFTTLLYNNFKYRKLLDKNIKLIIFLICFLKVI